MKRPLPPQPKVSAFARALVIGAWSLLGPGGVLLLLYSVLHARQAYSGADWVLSALLAGFLLYASWYLGLEILSPFFTELDTEGVRYSTLGGMKRLAWSDLTAIELKAQHVTLMGPNNQTVRLNAFCYQRPGDLLPFLAAAAPGVPLRQ